MSRIFSQHPFAQNLCNVCNNFLTVSGTNVVLCVINNHDINLLVLLQFPSTNYPYNAFSPIAIPYPHIPTSSSPSVSMISFLELTVHNIRNIHRWRNEWIIEYSCQLWNWDLMLLDVFSVLGFWAFEKTFPALL